MNFYLISICVNNQLLFILLNASQLNYHLPKFFNAHILLEIVYGSCHIAPLRTKSKNDSHDNFLSYNMYRIESLHNQLKK